MRTIIVTFILFTFCSLLNGQQFCDTPVSNNANLQQILKTGQSYSYRMPSELRVYFHVINSGFTDTEIHQAFDNLNANFDKFGISFRWGCYIDQITTSVAADVDSNNDELPDILSVNDHVDGIDIYFFPVAAGAANNGFAYGVGEGSALYLSGEIDGSTLALSDVVSHEMGHILGLEHTDVFGFGISPYCVEEPDGSNCEDCGDEVCDTPADPGLNTSNVNAACEYTGSAPGYEPDVGNIMSRTPPRCMDPSQRVKEFV